MILLLEHGSYGLTETVGNAKMLNLSEIGVYAWIYATGIGEILVASGKKNPTGHILAMGKYRIYQVKDESKLTDTIHLELFVGEGIWQGYLLITGLPKGEHKRARIVPTKEIITRSKNFSPQPAPPQVYKGL